MEHLQWEFNKRIENQTLTADELAEELNTLNTEEVTRLIPMIAFLALIAIVGIPGNGLVCYIYRSMYSMSSSRWFIFFLAVVDMIMCVIILPCEIATTFMQYNFKNDILCKASTFFSLWSLLSLGFILVIVSIDRYRKVCKPLGWQINFNKARLLSVAAVVLGFVIALPVLWLYGIYNIQFNHVVASECSFRGSMQYSNFALWYLLFGFAVFGASLIIICVLYCFIGSEIKQHIHRENIKRHISLSASMARRHNNVIPTVDLDITLKKVKFADDEEVCKNKGVKFSEPCKETPTDIEVMDDTSTNMASDDDDTCDFEVPVMRAKNLPKSKSRRVRRAKARKATFSMFLISIAFVLSYLPLLCLLLTRSVVEGFDESLSASWRAVYKFCLRSCFLSCAINPFIYGISDSRFRQSCKDVLFSLFERVYKLFRCV